MNDLLFYHRKSDDRTFRVGESLRLERGFVLNYDYVAPDESEHRNIEADVPGKTVQDSVDRLVEQFAGQGYRILEARNAGTTVYTAPTPQN